MDVQTSQLCGAADAIVTLQRWVDRGELPNEVIWAASIAMHTTAKHGDPWELCSRCGENIVGPAVLAALKEAIYVASKPAHPAVG